MSLLSVVGCATHSNNVLGCLTQSRIVAVVTDQLTRPLTPKGLATRDRIVAAATALIGAHGVAGLSNEQVRQRAGVSGSQLSHYFGSKQELVRAVITRQADAAPGGIGVLELGALDSFEALEAWADAGITRQAENDCRGDCSFAALAGELAASDDSTRAAISDGFLRWKDVLRRGLAAMRERGELRREADVDELAYALLSALQGGALLSQTLRTIAPMRSGMNAALAYVRSFEPPTAPPSSRRAAKARS